jgi:FkbM family methyltransferase
MTSPVPAPLEIAGRLLAGTGRAAGAGVAFDVGAHVGNFSRELLDSGRFAEVVAFEPDARNLAALRALEQRYPRFTVVPRAVDAAAGEREFHHDGDPATGSLLPYRTGYANEGPQRTARVAATTLDGHRETLRAGMFVNVLKIDTQGRDLAVLRGGRGLLKADRPVVIVEMIYLPLYEDQCHPEEIAAEMAAAGYELYALFNIHATAEGRLAFADAMFAPRELVPAPSQKFVQLDQHASYIAQIAALQEICRERLDVINVLDAEVKRLATAKGSP